MKNKSKYNNYSKNKYCKCGKLITNFAMDCRKCADRQHSLQMKGNKNSMYGSKRICKENPFFGRKHNEKTKQIMRKFRLGKKHTQNTIKKIKKHATKYWLNKKRPKKTCQKISKTRIVRKVAKGRKNPHFGKPASQAKKIIYKKILMRSSWEIAYAKWLDKNNIKWSYESKTFDLGNSTYTPDFYLPKQNKYIEIKGYYRKSFIKKFQRFKKLYPEINIQIENKKLLKKEGII